MFFGDAERDLSRLSWEWDRSRDRDRERDCDLGERERDLLSLDLERLRRSDLERDRERDSSRFTERDRDLDLESRFLRGKVEVVENVLVIEMKRTYSDRERDFSGDLDPFLDLERLRDFERL